MNKISNLVVNIGRSFALSFRFAPILTVGLTVATIVTGVLPLYQAKVMGNIVNAVINSISSNVGLNVILWSIILYSSIWAITGIIRSVRFYFDRRWTIKFEQGLEIAVLKKRAEIDLGHYESPGFQNLLTRAFSRSIWPIYNLVDVQMQIFASIAVIAISSFITTSINPLVYIIILATSIPSFIVNLKYGSALWSIWGENSQRRRKYEHIRHHINSRTGVTQNKLAQASARLIQMAHDFLESFNNEQLGLDKKKVWFSVMADLLAATGYAMSFWIITKEVVSGNESVGSMVFLISIIGQLVGSINSLLTMLANQFERNQYANDIFTVLDTKPYIKISSNPVRLNLKSSPEIEFKNVSFKYDDRPDWILRNLNFIIKPGEKIALVGENGAGKSTLIKLLSRIYDPSEGEILINGTPLTKIDITEWNDYLAVLLQDYITYDFSVIESIGMGRANIETDRARAIKSAEQSGADEFIKDYSMGYDQQLGKEFDNGIEPSKGQHQKIALARTIYRNGFIMILDEPTAAIDAVSEMKIFDQMENASGKNTLILITHRFNTTQNVDRIIVLEKGSIVEEGDHSTLVKSNGMYKKMFESQAKAFRE